MRNLLKLAILIFDKCTNWIPSKKIDILIINEFGNYKLMLPHFDTNNIKIVDYSYKNIFYVAYLIRRSKVIYVDNINLAIASIDNIESKVIQVWHATSAVKKFGMQTITDVKELEKRKFEYSKYDIITANSTFMKKVFTEAFGVKQQAISEVGCLQSHQLFADLSVSENFEYIMYVPTFRKGDNQETIDFIENFKSDKYKLLYSLHPKVEASINNHNCIKIDGDKVRDYLKNASLVISDYSSLLVDASLVNQSVVMFAYDYDSYLQEQGLNITKDFWNKFINTNEEMLTYINKGEFLKHDCNEIKQNLFTYDDIDSPIRIANIANEILKMRG